MDIQRIHAMIWAWGGGERVAFHSHDSDVGVKGPCEGQPADGWRKIIDMVGRSTERGHGGQAQADQAGCGRQGGG